MENVGYRKVHAYAASFGDDLARELIDGHTQAGDVILDPFVGAATVLLQARLLGRSAIGIDIDPVACLIARVIGTSYSLGELDELYQRVVRQVAEVETELSGMPLDEETWCPGAQFSINGVVGIMPYEPKIQYWFEPVQRATLAVLTQLVKLQTDPRQADVLRLAISSAIIRKWPNTLSLARDIDHSRPHKVSRTDLSVASQFKIFRRVLKGIVQTLRNLNSQADHTDSTTQVIEGDACHVINQLEPDSVDYVLTSPPYFNAIDYPRAHQFSQWWLWQEQEPLTRNRYVGLRTSGKDTSVIAQCDELIPYRIHEIRWLQEVSRATYASLCRYIADLNAIIGGLTQVIKPGKTLTFVLANNTIRGVVVPLSNIVGDLLEQNGLASIEIQQRQIRASRRRYPYGITGFKGLMHSEYLIHARKPS